ncbi:hypothetical protein BGZ58_009490 [Dissophora ornata]|nr:hypothetical protein BGZ58_009490 [Dissophora ornata]
MNSRSSFIDGVAMYVDGGDFLVSGNWTHSQKAFTINLSVSWNASNPAITGLPDGPPVPRSATITSDKSNWLVLGNVTSVYSIQSSTWTDINTPNYLMTDGLTAMTTDPTTGIIYASNGYEYPNTSARYMLKLNLTSGTWDSGNMYNSTTAAASYMAWSEPLQGAIEYNAGSGALHAYSPTNLWSSLNTSGAVPGPRTNACFVAAYGGSKMVLFGGATALGPARDIYVLDVASLNWTRGPDASPSNARVGQSCAASYDAFIVWGGYDGSILPSPANATMVYNLRTNSWTSSYIAAFMPNTTGTTQSVSTTTAAALISASPNTSATQNLSTNTSEPGPHVIALLGSVGALLLMMAIVGGVTLFNARSNHAKVADDDFLKPHYPPSVILSAPASPFLNVSNDKINTRGSLEDTIAQNKIFQGPASTLYNHAKVKHNPSATIDTLGSMTMYASELSLPDRSHFQEGFYSAQPSPVEPHAGSVDDNGETFLGIYRARPISQYSRAVIRTAIMKSALENVVPQLPTQHPCDLNDISMLQEDSPDATNTMQHISEDSSINDVDEDPLADDDFIDVYYDPRPFSLYSIDKTGKTPSGKI